MKARVDDSESPDQVVVEDFLRDVDLQDLEDEVADGVLMVKEAGDLVVLLHVEALTKLDGFAPGPGATIGLDKVLLSFEEDISKVVHNLSLSRGQQHELLRGLGVGVEVEHDDLLSAG